MGLSRDENEGWTPLQMATDYPGNGDLIQLLLDWGSDIDDISSTDGGSSLYYCVERRHYENMKVLLENGAVVTRLSNSPLQSAVKLHDSRAIRLLMKYGADPYQDGTFRHAIESKSLYELMVILECRPDLLFYRGEETYGDTLEEKLLDCDWGATYLEDLKIRLKRVAEARRHSATTANPRKRPRIHTRNDMYHRVKRKRIS